jgi:hypothetical protein
MCGFVLAVEGARTAMALGLFVCPWLPLLISKDDKSRRIVNKVRSDILPTVGCNREAMDSEKSSPGRAKQGTDHCRDHDHSQVARRQGIFGTLYPKPNNQHTETDREIGREPEAHGSGSPIQCQSPTRGHSRNSRHGSDKNKALWPVVEQRWVWTSWTIRFHIIKR